MIDKIDLLDLVRLMYRKDTIINDVKIIDTENQIIEIDFDEKNE